MALRTDFLRDAGTVFARHRAEIGKIMQQYREDVALCDSRFSKEFAAERRALALSEARGKVAQADREMNDKITEFVKEARSELYCEAVRMPIAAVRDALEFYQRFAIKMTATDVRACAESVKGNYIATRALQGIAAASGFKVRCPDLAEIDRDIKKLENAARVPNMYAPAEYFAEAIAIMDQVPYFHADGAASFTGRKSDAVYFSINEHNRAQLEKALTGEMRSRWQNFHAVNIEAVQGENGTDEAESAETAPVGDVAAPEVSVDNDLNGAAIAAENAASEARAMGIVNHYRR